TMKPCFSRRNWARRRLTGLSSTIKTLPAVTTSPPSSLHDVQALDGAHGGIGLVQATRYNGAPGRRWHSCGNWAQGDQGGLGRERREAADPIGLGRGQHHHVGSGGLGLLERLLQPRRPEDLEALLHQARGERRPRSSCSTSQPSRLGSTVSITIRSGRISSALRIASSPSWAWATRKPAAWISAVSRWLVSGSSSITSASGRSISSAGVCSGSPE